MWSYWWVKTHKDLEWEPAVRLESGGVIEWYLTGSTEPIVPAVIGPKLEAPTDAV